jgi:glutathione S-transferase
MSELIIWTLDWVPEGPRGFVRDLRLRWACEEAGRNYTVRTVPFEDRETNHLARQPFGQVPFLSDGELQLTSRPAFKKAHADQMAHFEAADA